MQTRSYKTFLAQFNSNSVKILKLFCRIQSCLRDNIFTFLSLNMASRLGALTPQQFFPNVNILTEQSQLKAFVFVIVSHFCLTLVFDNHTRGLYYKILRTRNVLQIDRFRGNLVPCILSVTNTLAYYEIRTLQTRNIFIVQAQLTMLLN